MGGFISLCPEKTVSTAAVGMDKFTTRVRFLLNFKHMGVSNAGFIARICLLGENEHIVERIEVQEGCVRCLHKLTRPVFD